MRARFYDCTPVRLVCCDLDGTLLGDDATLLHFAGVWKQLPQNERPWLVYNTGRTVGDVLGLIRRTPLPRPDYVIGAVGCEIFDLRRRTLRMDRLAALERNWCANAAHRCTLGIRGMTLQNPEFQSEFKRSYFWETPPAGGIADLRHRLLTAGLEAKVIHSSGRDLDILPAEAGKGAALAWLASTLSIRLTQVIACGDSANDREMLELPGVRAVVLRNDRNDLNDFKPGPRTAVSSLPAAAGVMEGLQCFGILDEPRAPFVPHTPR